MSTACFGAGGAFIAGNLAVMGGAGRRLVLRVRNSWYAFMPDRYVPMWVSPFVDRR